MFDGSGGSDKGDRQHPQAPEGIESVREQGPNKTHLERLAVQPGTSDKCVEDYTAFKGRGRYAQNPYVVPRNCHAALQLTHANQYQRHNQCPLRHRS
jgi:hypothetical protein